MRASTTCDQCGQTDTAPKHSISSLADATLSLKHYDCFSVREREAVVGSGQEPGGPKASAIIAACEDGTKGDDLLALIVSGDLPDAEGLAHQAQLAEEAAK